MTITLQPIGFVRSGRTEIADDDWGGLVSVIELDERYEPDSLAGLETFSHADVIFHFDQVDEAKVVCGARHPRNNTAWPAVGIFAQRGKNRPNRLGLTTVEIVKLEGRKLFVTGLDAVDGTPVLDIKPVMVEFLPRSTVRQPAWTHELMQTYWRTPVEDGASASPHEDTLRAAYDAFNRRDVDAVLALLTDDVAWPDMLQGRVLHGKAPVRAYWAYQFTLLDSRVEPERFVAEGGRVLAVVRQRVHRLDDDSRSESTVAHLYTFRGARVAAMQVHAEIADAERALRAAADPDVTPAVELIVAARRRVPATRSVLAAVSGIDGSGKGWVTARIVGALEARGLRVASINIDGWLELPQVRFSMEDPAGHFYRHAIRVDDLFAQLVLPLRERRSIRVETDFAEETATAYRKQVYAFDDVDVIVLEGIYLLQPRLSAHYDVSVWIDCSFETALERALARGQEGLPPDDTVRAYRTTYFAAQEIHFAHDRPRESATLVLPNDPRLARG